MKEIQSQEIPVYTLIDHSEKKEVPFEFITMEEIGAQREEENHVPHRHDFFAIIWVKKGKGNHLIDYTNYSFGDNTIFFLAPGHVHLVKEEIPCQGYVILFTEEFLGLVPDGGTSVACSMISQAVEFPYIVPNEEESRAFQKVVDSIGGEFKANELGRDEIIRSQLKVFMLLVARHRDRLSKLSGINPLHPTNDYYRNFLVSLERNFKKVHSVSAYSEMLHITSAKLNELVKSNRGTTASQMIKDRLILEAKRNLSHTEKTVKEIAFELGFEDHSYFIRTFRIETGKTPQEFREEQRSLWAA
ncbi:MAG: AraC family transcriptional regulator [Bacteroidia bacterium]|nr:AraC family transcriptional regulator [Bacteroidia bacterium]